MKLVAALPLLGLASATPVSQQKAKAASAQDAEVLADAPVWVWHPDYISDDYYGTYWHTSLTLEEVPNAGENANDICDGIANMSEGWCPKNEEQAKRVYSELVVRNFMPNSFATGVLDESEVSNIPTNGLGLGYRTRNWDDSWTIPDPIDNVDNVANRGANGPNDVYMCGPVYGGDGYIQNVETPTIGFLDDTASAPNHCTALGLHEGFGDDFDNFKLKNVDCSETRYIICADFWLPSAGTSHGGFPAVAVELNSTSVDIMKAAFDILYNPANQVVEEVEEVEDTSSNSTTTDTTTDTTTATPESKGLFTPLNIVGVVVLVAIIAFFATKK